jgi:hypothetical protein
MPNTQEERAKRNALSEVDEFIRRLNIPQKTLEFLLNPYWGDFRAAVAYLLARDRR